MSEDLQKLVDTAEASIRAAALTAEADNSRPLYHFRAPSQWMDDPNGIIFHEGMYHMMYSLNPHSAEHRAGMVYKTAVRVWDPTSDDWTGGITVWGHARSADLVHWEHLPIAVYPAIDKGEHFVWFGCTVINDEGIPMAIYTAIGPDMRPEDTAQQWAALGDKELMTWKPLPSNPMLTNAVHGGEVIREWRDPFLFKEAGRTFMILGGRTVDAEGGQPVVALYEAKNASFTSWDYRGIIFRHPNRSVPSAECPNLFKLNGKWVLFVSPHAEVEYYVGHLDLNNYTFSIETSGIVDYSRNFYATNVLFDGGGRALCWGALVGFTGTRGWNCCVSLPRELELDGQGILHQRPAKELHQLRGSESAIGCSLEAGGSALLATMDEGEALEMEARFDHDPAATFEVWLDHAGGTLIVEFSAQSITIDGHMFDVKRDTAETSLRLLIDRTVLELFVDETTAATRVIPLISGPVKISLIAIAGRIADAKGSIWQLKADRLFSNFQS